MQGCPLTAAPLAHSGCNSYNSERRLRMSPLSARKLPGINPWKQTDREKKQANTMVANCKHAYIHIVYIYYTCVCLFHCFSLCFCLSGCLNFDNSNIYQLVFSIFRGMRTSSSGIHKCPVRVEVRAMTITANTPWSKRIESSSHAHQPVSSFQTTPGILERAFRGFDCSIPVTQDKKTIKGCATKFENRFLRKLTHTC